MSETASTNEALENEEEGISIWLALAISLGVLILGIWLIRGTSNHDIIPASGQGEMAFVDDVLNFSLPEAPTLMYEHADPARLTQWQQEQDLPAWTPQVLGIRRAIGSSGLHWNGQAVTYAAAYVGPHAVWLYCFNPSWPHDPSMPSMMSFQSAEREVVSWHMGELYYVAVPIQSGVQFPDAWKQFILQPTMPN